MTIDESYKKRRFRPILRMNDLLHPIQQRERMDALLCISEVKNTYSTYSRIGAMEVASAVFVVKAPGTAKRLDEDTYLVLMQQRLNWLMQGWMQELHGSQFELEKLLRKTVVAMQPNSLQENAELNDDSRLPPLKQWCSEWAEILIHQSDRLLDLLHAENIRFPMPTWDSSHPNFHEFCELHDATDLETWLALLAG